MKRTILFLTAAMMLGIAMPSIAQQRKTVKRSNTIKRNTTSVAKPKPSTASSVKTIAVYDIKAGIKSFSVTDNAIYYLEKGNNNAVMSIDRKTGKFSTIIPGIANVYENARPYIRKILICGSRLILECGEGSFVDRGIYVYDGHNVESSMKLCNSGSIIVGNDKYLIIDNGDIRSIQYWRLDNIKPFKTENVNMEGGFTPRFIGSDGSVWTTYGLTAVCRTLSGKRIEYSLEKEPYVMQAKNYTALTERGTQIDDYLYVNLSRRIYRINLITPSKWEEYAKVPPTIDNRFEWFCPDSKGNLYTQGVSNEENNTQYWRVGEFSSPKSLGRELKTGLKKWDYEKVWLSLAKNATDEDGNLISVRDYRIYIYNPNGVIGYTNAVGGIVEN